MTPSETPFDARLLAVTADFLKLLAEKPDALARLLWPDGISPIFYGDFIVIARVFDRLQGLLNGRDEKKPEAPNAIPVHSPAITVQPERISAGFKCDKHAGAEFNTKGECKVCRKLYAKTKYVKRQKKGPRPAVSCGFKCEFHPGTRFSAKGECLTCKAIYARRKRSPPPDGHWILCPDCNEKFSDSRAMGIHRTKTHFGPQHGINRSGTGVAMDLALTRG